MNKQEIFNEVAKHLLTQGARSWNNEGRGTCAYRSGDGKKCAIGCLIPDELYDPKMEYTNVYSLLRSFPSLNEILKAENGQDILFLQRLQRIHDLDIICSWEHSLMAIASEYGLDTSVLEDF